MKNKAILLIIILVSLWLWFQPDFTWWNWPSGRKQLEVCSERFKEIMEMPYGRKCRILWTNH